jgi:hypothetical protein
MDKGMNETTRWEDGTPKRRIPEVEVRVATPRGYGVGLTPLGQAPMVEENILQRQIL